MLGITTELRFRRKLNGGHGLRMVRRIRLLNQFMLIWFQLFYDDITLHIPIECMVHIWRF